LLFRPFTGRIGAKRCGAQVGIHAVVIGLLGATLLNAAPACAASEADPGIGAFVQYWESAARSIKSIPLNDKKGVVAACRELTDASFEFDAMAQDALPAIWPKLDVLQRKTLAAAIARKAASDCVRHVEDYGGAPFTILGIRIADDGDRLATANVRTAAGRNVHVTWRLRPGDPGHWKAVDLIVEGRSTTAGVRGEFSRVLASKHGNLPAAVEAMGKR
jgi:ABC-type transporter MlaC component